MTGIISKWILGLTGAAVVCAAATELCPKGRVKTAVRAISGLIMAMALLSPIAKMDFAGYSLSMELYRERAGDIISQAEENTKNLSRRSIEDQCRAYILDKAKLVGAEIADASVTLRWSGEEECWYPVGAAISGQYNERLASYIEAELGISKTEQSWNQ